MWTQRNGSKGAWSAPRRSSSDSARTTAGQGPEQDRGGVAKAIQRPGRGSEERHSAGVGRSRLPRAAEMIGVGAAFRAGESIPQYLNWRNYDEY